MDAAVIKRRPRFSATGIPLPRIDQRTVSAMRYRSLLDSYASELGIALSEPDRALVQQLASLQLKIEQMQAAIIEGRDTDADQIIRLSSEHRRLLATLKGKADKAKPAPDDALQRYLATSNFQVPDAGDDAEHEAETDNEPTLEPESTPVP
jgi:hypothetical protein